MAFLSERPGMRNSNVLYALVGALIVVVIGFSVYAYREETKPKGVELKLDQNGVSLQNN